MENLEHDVVDATLEVVSKETSIIKRVLPVLAPVVVLAVVFFGVRKLKRNKAKKAVANAAEEVNPVEPKE